MRGTSRIAPFALVAAAAAWAAFALAVQPSWAPDDAYILVRYVENLTRHGELTWNVGEDPVEGYTGLTLPLCMAAASWLGVAPLAAAKAIGLAAFFAGAGVLAALSRELGARPSATAATVALYLTTPETYAHALSGLETSLFAALVGASALALARATRAAAPPVTDAFAAAVALLAALTRPEGAVAVAVVAAGVVRARAARGERRALARFAGAFALGCLLPGAAYFVARWHHYGRLLPNTFYAKVGAFPGAPEFPASLATFADRVVGGLAGGALLLALTAALVAPRALAARLAERRWQLAALAALVVPPFAVYARSHLAMDYHHRFAFHFAIPLFAALGVVASDALWVLRSANVAWRAALARVAAAALVASGLVANVHRRAFVAEYVRNYETLTREEHAAVGAWLRANLAPGSLVAVYEDVGLIGLLSGLPIVDFGRLNDEHLAEARRTQAEGIVAYFFSRTPAAFVATSFRAGEVAYEPAAEAITRDPRFSERYALVRTFETTLPIPDRELVYVRRDLAVPR